MFGDGVVDSVNVGPKAKRRGRDFSSGTYKTLGERPERGQQFAIEASKRFTTLALYFGDRGTRSLHVKYQCPDERGRREDA